MIYKKGSIVPRSLVRSKSRKTRHIWTFGADVEVIGREVRMLTDGHCFNKSKDYIGGKKGKPRRYDIAAIYDVHVIGFVPFLIEQDANPNFSEGYYHLNNISTDDLKWKFRGEE